MAPFLPGRRGVFDLQVDSFCETGDNVAKNHDPGRMRKCLESCIDWNTDLPMQIDNDLPAYVWNNVERYRHML